MSQQDNVKAAAEGVANLHLDEATGEMVSKSELKKRIKQRQVEAKKAAKKAALNQNRLPKKKQICSLTWIHRNISKQDLAKSKN